MCTKKCSPTNESHTSGSEYPAHFAVTLRSRQLHPLDTIRCCQHSTETKPGRSVNFGDS
jgi:hypothetical protein